ncbi:MAG: sulfite exporter TauE/SafE family protein [Acidiferrobacterales bacterium]
MLAILAATPSPACAADTLSTATAFGLGLPMLIVAALALVLGGFVKGAIGVGLPVVTIAALSNVLPVPLVLAIVTLPILLTNLWQAVHAGNLRAPLIRFWPMILCLLVLIWLSARLVVTLDPRVLYALIGAAVMVFTITSYFKITWTVSPSAEKWAGPLAGTLGGFLGGISTIWGPPMMIYFVMLRLPKEVYIQAVGLVWFIASIPLVIAYARYGILTVDTTPLSALACIPGFVGLAIGQRLRKHINQEAFRKLLLLFLFIVGLNLLRRAIY